MDGETYTETNEMPDDLRAWFPLYVQDFVSGRTTRRMDAGEIGIFILLLCEQWHGGPLPKDPDELAHIGRAPWEEVEAILQRGFVLNDKGWVNERLIDIWMEQKGKRHAASRAGKIGAEARWGKKPKLIDSGKAPVDTEEDGNRNATALATALPSHEDEGSEDVSMRSHSDRNATPMALEESRGEESRVEENTTLGQTESEESKKPRTRKRFRSDVIYIRDGLDYGAQPKNGKTPTISRGYNEVPIQPFLDYAAGIGESVQLPNPLVIETQEQLTAFLEG